MFLTLVAAFAALDLADDPPSPAPSNPRVLEAYRSILADPAQWHRLTPLERAEILELHRRLSAQEDRTSETKAECRKRQASATPTELEEALIDLKCSQRPSGD